MVLQGQPCGRVGRRRNYGSPLRKRRAFFFALVNLESGVKQATVEDDNGRPVVTGISGPTDLGTYDFHASVPLQEDISYGVTAAILALIETSGL